MVDNTNFGQPPIPPQGQKPRSPIVGYLTSSTGRLLVGGALLFVVLVVAGALAFFFFLNGGGQTPTTSSAPVHGGSKTASVTVPPSAPPEAGLKETFTFRNIFAPTVHPVTATTSSSSGTAVSSTSESETSSTTSTTSGAKDTLILKSIATDNGVRVATFEWNGANFTVSAGDQVDSSPWQVISIGSDSALMLFGDSQVTLTVGQGFSKNDNQSISK